jgi:hypothetical protein
MRGFLAPSSYEHASSERTADDSSLALLEHAASESANSETDRHCRRSPSQCTNFWMVGEYEAAGAADAVREIIRHVCGGICLSSPQRWKCLHQCLAPNKKRKKGHSNSIASRVPRVRRKRQRLPPNLLSKTPRIKISAPPQKICSEAFPIKASG